MMGSGGGRRRIEKCEASRQGLIGRWTAQSGPGDWSGGRDCGAGRKKITTCFFPADVPVPFLLPSHCANTRLDDNGVLVN